MAHKENTVCTGIVREMAEQPAGTGGNKWAGMACPNDERCEKYRVCANCNGVMGKCQTYQKVKRGEL